MLLKNQIYEATVTDYTEEGQGVAHVEGCVVFLPNAVAGERVKPVSYTHLTLPTNMTV